LREIDAQSIDMFSEPYTKIISVPIKSNDNWIKDWISGIKNKSGINLIPDYLF
jgi:hypothetical protein